MILDFGFWIELGLKLVLRRMTSAAREILDQLNDDLVDYGFFVQSLNDETKATGTQFNWPDVLRELLLGDVEIGDTDGSPTYVAFLAWRGSVDARVARAMKCVADADPFDRPFAFWLCLRKNIDRYESGDSL